MKRINMLLLLCGAYGGKNKNESRFINLFRIRSKNKQEAGKD